MADENLGVPPRAGDRDPEDVTLEAELVDKDAEREIDKAVRGRRGVARKYVRRVRRRNPDATPAEIISMLEHHYVTAISVAGAAITVGSIAGEIGIAMIPGVGAAAAGTKAVAKEAAKKATKGNREDDRQTERENCGEVRCARCGEVRRSASRRTTSRRSFATPVRDHRALRPRGRQHSRNGLRPAASACTRLRSVERSGESDADRDDGQRSGAILEP